jgi:hypothetical protein
MLLEIEVLHCTYNMMIDSDDDDDDNSDDDDDGVINYNRFSKTITSLFHTTPSPYPIFLAAVSSSSPSKLDLPSITLASI